MRGFVDIHSHFVYGMDDGAQTEEEMYAMLDMAYQNGISRLYATPHVVPGMRQFDDALFESHFSQAEQYCQERGYGMEFFPGAENLFTPQMEYYARNRLLRCMGTTSFVLIEFSPSIALQDIEQAIEMLLDSGYKPIIAHAERYSCLLHGNNLRQLKKQYDIRVQMNANTIIRKQPFLSARKHRKWLSNQLIDFIASDAHNVSSRPFLMNQAAAVLGRCYSAQSVDSVLTGGLSE